MSKNAHKDGGPFAPTPLDHKGGHGGPRGISVRLWLAGQATQSLLADADREWIPEKRDIVPDENGKWNVVESRLCPWYTATTPFLEDDDKATHIRGREANTWRDRLVREALAIADALLAADAANPPKAVSP